MLDAQTDKQLIEKASPADAGCWIGEANWGRFGSIRLVQLAVLHGWELNDEDEAIFDRLWRECELPFPQPASADDWSALIDQGGIAEAAEDWLNEHVAPEGYSFGWSDGDFVLWPEHAWCEEYCMCDCTSEQIHEAQRFTYGAISSLSL